MLLENLAFTEVEEYLKEKDIVLVPIGSVEQHSPYGLIGTDFIAAEAVARRAGEALGILVAPTVCYGVSDHHMGFKGTVTLRPDTMIQIVMDLVRSLVAHGFRRILFVNGHGGNINTLGTAFSQLKSEGINGYFDQISWYDAGPVKKLSKELFGDAEGHHATPSEVSITKTLRPEMFSGKTNRTKSLIKKKYYWPLSAREMKKVFPDGRMESAPWLASEKAGKKVLDCAVTALEKHLKKIMNYEIIT